MSNLTRTIQKLSEWLTDPDFINPLYQTQTQPNTVPQNTSIQNTPITEPSPFIGENKSHLDNDEEGREIGEIEN